MKREHFKKFYSNELKNNKIQEYLIIKDRTEILVELIKDEFYTFDYFFCLKYIESHIKNSNFEFNFDIANLK